MTIFDNLVYNENTFTELFKNLMRFKVFRKEFLGLLQDKLPKNVLSSQFSFGEEEIGFENFSTQKTIENGRPDLVISNSNLEIFIEIKVGNANLTPNQPLGYLRELANEKEKGNKLLVLLAPSNYSHLKEYQVQIPENPDDFPNVKAIEISWTDVIEKIDDTEIFAGNSLLTEYRALLKEWFEPPTIVIDVKFIKIMNNRETPDSILKLTQLINQLEIKLHEEGNKKTSSGKKDILDEYGFYYKKEGAYNLFIGEWFDFWQATGNSLCIAIEPSNDHNRAAFENKLNELNLKKDDTYKNDYWFVRGIAVDLGNNNVKDLTEQLERIIDSLNRVAVVN